MTDTVTFRTDLPFSEQLVLWSIRQWVLAHGTSASSHDSSHDLLRDAYRLARAPGAALALDGFLTIAFTASRAAIEIHPPAAPSVTDHEARLLSVVAHAQVQGGAVKAGELLGTWLPPAGRRLAMRCCIDLAAHLIGGGHLLRPWSATETELVQRPENAGSETAPVLLN